MVTDILAIIVAILALVVNFGAKKIAQNKKENREEEIRKIKSVAAVLAVISAVIAFFL